MKNRSIQSIPQQILLIFWIILTVLYDSQRAFGSDFGAEATKNGDYYVCPDGRAAKWNIIFATKDWHWSMDLPRSREARVQMVGANSEVIIGKSVLNYSESEINALLERFLNSVVDISTSYKSTEFYWGSSSAGYAQPDQTIIKVTNNARAVISVKSLGPFGNEITDSQGRLYKYDITKHASALYCPSGSNYILRRIVEGLKLNATDEYGKSETLPLIFMITNIYIRSEPPSLKNIPSF